ncbi:MAG: hypothetical protein EBU66_10310 [Bacteroidetes bacterium]|nr:hypothetical protein [bacterium]NBP65033.1 hypothetical protein [Bacteroidota bacterium]
MKKVTITFTRESLDTPWYWQVFGGTTLNPMNAYIEENSDKIETFGYDTPQGDKNIITFTFSDDQIYQDFRAMLEENVVSGYVQYCQDNNITIQTVVEDI